MPAPPVRLLTTILSPLHFSTCLARSRAVTSMPPPAGYTTVYSIGPAGKSLGLSLARSAFASPLWAAAGVANRAARNAKAIAEFFIGSFPGDLAAGGTSSRREPHWTKASAPYPDVG